MGTVRFDRLRRRRARWYRDKVVRLGGWERLGRLAAVALFLGFQGWEFGSRFLPGPLAAALLDLLLLEALLALVGVPIGFLRLRLRVAFELSTQTLSEAIRDGVKAFLLRLLFSGLLIAALALSLHWVGPFWWLAYALALGAAALVLLRLVPLFLALFGLRLTPLPPSSLRDHLLGLASRAALPVREIYQLDLSRKGTEGNAAVVGVGQRRRVIVSDTLLQQGFSDAEIAAIMAHELGHVAGRDGERILLLQTVFVAAAGLLAEALLAVLPLPAGAGGRLFLRFLLWEWSLALLLQPLQNAFSRRREERADRYAARLTGSPLALLSALVRLSDQNLSDLRPRGLYDYLYHYTHPPVLERIRTLWHLRHS